VSHPELSDVAVNGSFWNAGFGLEQLAEHVTDFFVRHLFQAAFSHHGVVVLVKIAFPVGSSVIRDEDRRSLFNLRVNISYELCIRFFRINGIPF